MCNIAIKSETFRFVFSTLWSKISLANKWPIEGSIIDFRLIKYNNYPLTAEKFNQVHEESLNFVTSELQEKMADKTIVVTHHAPTFMHYPAKIRVTY